MVFYTNRFIPKWAAGCTRGPFVFIRPQYADDAGLLVHEKVHVKQWLRTLGLHGFLYFIYKKYRLKSEVEAYSAQAACYQDDRKPIFAELIASNYDIDITPDSALKLLNRIMPISTPTKDL